MAQVPTVSKSTVEQPHSYCTSAVWGEYHCYSFGTDEDRRGILCIDSTSQLSPYVKTVIFRYFPHETPKERLKTKHKQLCEMVLHLTATLILQGEGQEVGGARMGSHTGVTHHPKHPHCMHYCARHMRLTSHDIGGLTKTSSRSIQMIRILQVTLWRQVSKGLSGVGHTHKANPPIASLF